MSKKIKDSWFGIGWMRTGMWRCKKSEWRDIVLEIARRLLDCPKDVLKISEEYISSAEGKECELDRIVHVLTPNFKDLYFLVSSSYDEKEAIIHLLKQVWRW